MPSGSMFSPSLIPCFPRLISLRMYLREYSQLIALKVKVSSTFQQRDTDDHLQPLSLAVNILSAVCDLLIVGALGTLLHMSRTGHHRFLARIVLILVMTTHDFLRTETIINRLVCTLPLGWFCGAVCRI
jgi:hypothetical protein